MFRNWKTTLSGIMAIGCTVGAIAFPEFAIPIGKIGALVTAGGLFLAKDHDVTGKPEEPLEEEETDSTRGTGTEEPKKKTVPLRTPRMMLILGFSLMGIFCLSSGFIGTSVNKFPLIYTGQGSPTNFPSAVGSFYVNLADTNVPVLWIKTSTNGFAAFISSNSLPADVSFNSVTITNGLRAADVIALNSLQSAGTLNVDGDCYLGVDSEGNILGGKTLLNYFEAFNGTNANTVDGRLAIGSLTDNKSVWTTNGAVLRSIP